MSCEWPCYVDINSVAYQFSKEITRDSAVIRLAL